MTTYLKSLNDSLKQVMAKDRNVYLIGEDIVDPYGGAFKVTKGLSTQFPGRVLSTPISEACIVGMATGMALRGLKPVVEIMFGDFITLAADQIVNEMCKFQLMFGGLDTSIVVRTPMGGGRGYGPTHSQSLEKLLLGVPGLRIVSPTLFHDPGALLSHAIIQTKGPTLFVEHKTLYSQDLVTDNEDGLNISVVDGAEGFPTVKVSNFRSGKADLVVIGYGGMSGFFKELLIEYGREEINMSIIAPSLLSEINLLAFMDDIRSAGRCVCIEEGAGLFGWTAEIANHVYENTGGALKKPIKRLTAKNMIIPSSRKLEQAMLPGHDSIREAIEEVLL